MAAGNTHLSAQERMVTAKTATVTAWYIRQYHMMTKTKSSKMQASDSDRRTSVSEYKLCVMQQLFKVSLPVTSDIFYRDDLL